MQKMQTFIKDAAVAPIDKYLRLRSLQKYVKILTNKNVTSCLHRVTT